ncbi:MAG: LssY C-terminal domain-containing protein [Akkermansiaceae bacterium]|nr:LssY C-terminal domain-containing protein [Akkermansiaceae bacterium]MBJ7285159.1 LssY C-terminal domain-containing protein [Akkermansiaceae bacterium]
MRFLIRLLKRLVIFGLGVFSVWLIVFVVFAVTDSQLPWIIAVSVTYGIGAYVILPRMIRMGLKIIRRQHVPCFTTTSDGLTGDPVNLALIGTMKQLEDAFTKAGWTKATPLGILSSWKMIRAFILNSPYPSAPFSTLYLLGRGQDIGFEKAIDDSPRKRHHIRFWAMSLAHDEANFESPDFWTNSDRPLDGESAMWVGAGTKDTGIALAKLTFQITHATAADANAERDFIVEELSQRGVIGVVTHHQAGDSLITQHAKHYITDGAIALANLTDDS